ncbi:acylneuraminate cytidylyltransferase family protein [Synechococcus sp. CC9311]|uniref:acylneuraminate cytidylyltransferase family protein n=1 Tax=Synechococcus sp. (strain CC9311) TaxID=64471 RepID=UPI0000DDA9C8|nr:acylneuraminate cytidylyltransferase family protein [Synechococcus sp. CC9311]ABI46379.1 Posttranslational flagellin modification protein B [Synechococcus sp. CC9311]
MKRICTICARAGSKRLANKNIAPLNGHPLIAYAIAAAHESKLFRKIVVTSDSREYLEIASRYGNIACVYRNAELSNSAISKTRAIYDAVLKCEQCEGIQYDTIVDLDVTAPLRAAADVIAAVKALEKDKFAESLVSVTESKVTPFSNLFYVDQQGFLMPMLSPEEVNEHTGSTKMCFALNAAIYAWKRDSFMEHPRTFTKKTLAFIMAEYTRFDIDGPIDLEFVEFLILKMPNRFVRPMQIKLQGEKDRE